MAYRKRSSGAKRRSTKRRSAPKTSRRRRRIGSVGSRKANIAKILGAVAGVVAPHFLVGVNLFGKTLDPKIIGAGSAVIGFLLPRFIKGDFVEGASLGLIGSGGALVLKEFNVINGIPIIAGWQNMKIINGPGASPTMSGASPTMSGRLRDNGYVSSFRPSASQMLNGYYRDGYGD